MVDKVAVLIVEQNSAQGIQNAINTKIDELKANKFYVKDVRIEVFHKGLIVSILYSFTQASNQNSMSQDHNDSPWNSESDTWYKKF